MFYGWIVLAAAWVSYLVCTTPVSYGGSVLTYHMAEEGIISVSAIAYSSSAKFAATAFASIVISLLVGKIGHRKIMLAGAVLMTACQFALFALPVSDLFLTVLYGLMGAGILASAVVTGPSLVNNWFDRNRALPMSLLLSAGAIGGFVMPVVTGWIDKAAGWRTGWLVFAAMSAAACVLTAVLVKERPEEIGECRDGRLWTQRHPAPEKDPSQDRTSGRRPLRELLTKLEFPVMSLLTFSTRACFAGVTSFLILYGVERGLSDVQAPLGIAVYNAAGFAGRMAAGGTDVFPVPRRILNAASYLCMTAGGLLLFMAGGTGTFFLGAALCGISFGFSYTVFPQLVPDCFGRDNFSALYGIFNAIAGVGSTVTPLALNLVAQHTGGFRLCFLMLGLLPLLCTGLALILPDPARGRP